MDEERLREILEDFIKKLEALLKQLPDDVTEEEKEGVPSLLSKNVLLEILSHEGIVLESYKDSKGIWTWGVGVTDRSGHTVSRYKDNPQPLSHVIKIFKWLLETKYLPSVLKAFPGIELTESQLAAALSFHYNTGAISKAAWVKSFLRGDTQTAREDFMKWRKPKEIIVRRQKECDLFFDGKWSNDGKGTVFSVRKPSYIPNWSSAKRVDISKEL